MLLAFHHGLTYDRKKANVSRYLREDVLTIEKRCPGTWDKLGLLCSNDPQRMIMRVNFKVEFKIGV